MRLLLVIIIIGFMVADVSAGQGGQSKAGKQTQQHQNVTEMSPAGQEKVRAENQHRHQKGQAKQKGGMDPNREMDGALPENDAQKGKGKKKHN